MVELNPGVSLSVPAIEELLRQKFKNKFPDVHFSFEASDVVSQILSIGSENPITVTVSGSDLNQVRYFTERLAGKLRHIPTLRDVQIPEALDYPTLDVKIDRVRAGQLGVTVGQVTDSIVTAASSSQLIIPNFWTDPKSGIPYRVSVQVPEYRLGSIEELRNLPVMANGHLHPLVSDVATVTAGQTFGEIDHYNNQRSLSVIANIGGRDLLGAAEAVKQAIATMGTPPRGVTVALHGQAKEMTSTLASLRLGLMLSVIVVLILLVGYFQSFREPLAIVATIPGVLAGVLISLFLTGSSLNLESLIGAIMSIGVGVASSVLLVSFARGLQQTGVEVTTDVVMIAALGRLRPVLMTAAAMIAGMIPMALGISEGGQQSAPLGRAVIGGISASLLTTLFVLPAIYTRLLEQGPSHHVSLDPEDWERSNFDRAPR